MSINDTKATDCHRPDRASKTALIRGWYEVVLVAAGSIAFGFLFSYPILPNLNSSGVYLDWDLIRVLAWVPWKTVTGFHQFPVWNPYLCGGIPMLGDPEASIITPAFLLHLGFGPVPGLYLEIPFHLAIAWAGGYVLARVLGLSTLAAITCATIFPASSWFYLHSTAGHHHFMSAAYWPWVLAFALRAINQQRLGLASIAGLFLALIFLEGAPYQVSFAVLLLGTVLVPPAIVRRDRWPFIVVGTVVIFAAGFAAVKLLPTYALMSQYPRPIYTREHVVVHDILTALFDRNQDCHRDAVGDWGFFDAGAYLGPIFFGFLVIGAVTRLRQTWPWIVAGAIMILLALGNFAPYAPWTLLHRLPIFSSERAAIRMLVPFILCAAVLGAYGVDFLDRWWPPWTSVFAALLLAAGALDALWVGPNNLANIGTSPEEPVPASATFKQFENPADGEYTSHMLRFNQANLGILRCYEYRELPTPVIGYNQPGYEGEQHLLGPGAVQLLQWTPNALTYEVETQAPTTLVINQNYDPGWKIAHGAGNIHSHDGLLAVDLPSGRQRLEVANRGNGLITGALITLAFAIAAALLWRSGL